MTHHPPHDQFAVRDQEAQIWGAARSHWLDAFADLELEVCKCSFRHCGGPNKKNFAQRLADLATVERSPKLSRTDQPKLRELAAQCQLFLDLRATLVHSRMRLGTSDSVAVALFRNVADQARDLPSYVVMTLKEIQASVEKLRRLAAELRRFANPSSPPPPKPGAAAGP
jgi:hypothetical protein